MSKDILDDLKKAVDDLVLARIKHSTQKQAYEDAIEELEFQQHKVTYLKSRIKREAE